MNFQRHYSSHDRSEIIQIFWFAAQNTFIIIIMLKTAEWIFFLALWPASLTAEQACSS